MQKALKLTNNITIAIEQGHHDENLINALQQHMNSLPNTYLGTEPYYRIMMNVFQISNHPNGFEENGCLGYLPIKLKEIAVCMIINLMKYFEENGIRKVPTHVQVKGLQIMIKSMRVFIIQHEKQPLDRDQLKKLLKYQQYCKQLYSTVGNLLQQQQQ